ncbi:hypothetical protein AB6A40_003034 [Gnathostoma spinigerum]|uniref:Uncharacterized protein n=1 Tax=Gnathostoma spinigerum TaxID=75299 RepID=A0ABD6E8C0_9BILA
MSSSEELAAEFEKGEKEITTQAGKRNKTEQVEHKRMHSKGDARKVVNYCASGEEKRKEDMKASSGKQA